MGIPAIASADRHIRPDRSYETVLSWESEALERLLSLVAQSGVKVPSQKPSVEGAKVRVNVSASRLPTCHDKRAEGPFPEPEV